MIVRSKYTHMGAYPIVWFEKEDLPSVTGYYISRWKEELRERINWLHGCIRPRVCLVCNRPFSIFQLHHAVVSKQDVRGWKPKKRLLIEVEMNLIPLHSKCHLDNPPTRERCWEHQCDFYGEELMQDWYNSLSWKVPQRRF